MGVFLFGGDEENPQAYLGLRVHPTQFAPLRFTNLVPVCTICAEKQFTGLFFNAQTFRSSILSESTSQKNTPWRFAMTCFLMVETRRIELLSENSSIGGSPSAVCDRYSLVRKLTNKLMQSVASLFMVCSKLCTLTFTAK